ncbi:MAG: [FeFe] hydrogenase, group A [bacterium]
MANFTVYINDKACFAEENETILTIAKRENIYIPALCFHCDLIAHESCRLCLVEVEGDKNLRTSCSLIAQPDMKVYTDTPLLKNVLKTNFELLFAQHKGKCETCKRKTSCKLYDLAQRYRKEMQTEETYSDRKKGCSQYQFGPSILLDQSKCINCENCLEVCAKQTKGGFLSTEEGEYNFEICPSPEETQDCLYCGQCIIHCPVGALSEVEDYQKVQDLLIHSKKKVVFQFAPAVRTSLGEEFGLPLGTNVTDKIFSALKKINAYKVFDTSFAADVTVIEEVRELIEKVKNNDTTVMFSSCCPAWVKYVETYEPSLIPYLTTVRSPQIILGGLIKTYWAQKEKVDQQDVIVVSVMPCTAKKFEILREELFINGVQPVDHVLTVREFAKLLKAFEVDFAQIEADETGKELLASPSGAGEIFGSSGGVLEAALRTAYHEITGIELATLEFKPLHQFNHTKYAEVSIGDMLLKVVAVNGMENAKKILDELKQDPEKYTYVEVMACRGGCIGGGGQPIPVNDTIRQARANGLYQSDGGKSVRASHRNKGVIELYEQFLHDDEMRHTVCHTHFKRREKGLVKKIES